jgi:lauroyl/myristoyl acyltransferase
VKVKPKHLFEYAALIALSRFLLLLPHRAALAIGWLVAVLGYYVVGYRVATAKARIREVFGDRFDEGAVSRIAWTSLRNMVFNVVETVRMPRVTRRWVADHIDTRSGAVSIREMIEGQGGLLVIPHMGNWDLAGVAVHLLGVPVFFIVGRQSNPLVDAELNRLRQVTGVETSRRWSGNSSRARCWRS